MNLSVKLVLGTSKITIFIVNCTAVSYQIYKHNVYNFLEYIYLNKLNF